MNTIDDASTLQGGLHGHVHIAIADTGLSPNFDNIPDTLKALPRWVVWRLESRDNKPTKVLYSARHKSPPSKAQSNNSATWTTFERARLYWATYHNHRDEDRRVDGVGFVFSADDDIMGIDFDNAVRDDGEIEPWAFEWLQKLDCGYGEISPSGRGFKLFGRGTLPEKGIASGRSRGGYGPDGRGKIEIFPQARYFTVTGNTLDHDKREITPFDSDALAAIVVEVDAKRPSASPKPDTSRASLSLPLPLPLLSLSDEELLDRARKAKNGHGFIALFDMGDTSAYNGDHSRADSALCSMLAFWTNRDQSRVESLFLRSALARRDKAQRPDYVERTVAFAIASTTETYGDRVGNGVSYSDPAPRVQKPRPAVLVNYDLVEDGQGNTNKIGRKAADIQADVREITGGFPKRVGSQLFAKSQANEVQLIGSPSQYIAYLNQHVQVDWMHRGPRGITQEAYYEYERMTAEAYDSVESLPHYPPVAGAFYIIPSIPRASGKFDRLIDFFCFPTPGDRQLFKALYATPFWGGEPGTRPAGQIGSDGDDDPDMGRGRGKTTATTIWGDILLDNGIVDVVAGDTIGDIKTRLLSPEGRGKRILRLDNVKSERLSWGELEGLITSAAISGRQLYSGEGRRPNNLTVVLTVNGGSLSKDLAQRVIPIRLEKPAAYSATWDQDVRRFAREYKLDIIADIRDLILANTDPSYTPRSRWASWEMAILSKLDDPDGLHSLIESRRDGMDGDSDDRAECIAIIEHELRVRGHDPDMASFFLPTRIIAEWINTGRNTKEPTNRVSAMLARLGTPQIRKSKRGCPGFIWKGRSVPVGATADTWVEGYSQPF